MWWVVLKGTDDGSLELIELAQNGTFINHNPDASSLFPIGTSVLRGNRAGALAALTASSDVYLRPAGTARFLPLAVLDSAEQVGGAIAQAEAANSFIVFRPSLPAVRISVDPREGCNQIRTESLLFVAEALQTPRAAARSSSDGRYLVAGEGPEPYLQLVDIETGVAEALDATMLSEPLIRLSEVTPGRFAALDEGGRLFAVSASSLESLSARSDWAALSETVGGVAWASGLDRIGRVLPTASGLRLEPDWLDRLRALEFDEILSKVAGAAQRYRRGVRRPSDVGGCRRSHRRGQRDQPPTQRVDPRQSARKSVPAL